MIDLIFLKFSLSDEAFFDRAMRNFLIFRHDIEKSVWQIIINCFNLTIKVSRNEAVCIKVVQKKFNEVSSLYLIFVVIIFTDK